MNAPHFLRFARALALVTSTTAAGCSTAPSLADGGAEGGAADGTFQDSARDAQSEHDGAIDGSDSAAVDGGSLDAPAAIDGAGDGAGFDVVAPFDGALAEGGPTGCDYDAGAPVASPADGAPPWDGTSPCLPLNGQPCASAGELACGGPGGATRFGCLCATASCASGEGGTRLAWICGGGGALPPPELSA